MSSFDGQIRVCLAEYRKAEAGIFVWGCALQGVLRQHVAYEFLLYNNKANCSNIFQQYPRYDWRGPL